MSGPRPALVSPRHALPFCFVWLLFFAGRGPGQPTTDPSEAEAVNSLFGRWGISSSMSKIPWNASNDLCSRGAGPAYPIFQNPDFNPGIVCDCGYDNNTVCHIARLKARELRLVGRFPRELENLKYLMDLDLGKNYLTGPLPLFIGNFSAMKFLSIGFNLFSGTIPKELGNLQYLSSLGIGTNNFSGPLPVELGNLTNLEQIYMDSLELSGMIPPSFAHLSRLRVMYASDNNFIGKFPDYIGNLTDLQSLRLRGTSIQGPIPESFLNLTKMSDLRMGDFSGKSSSLAFMRNMKSLSTLVLRNSKISDIIPLNIRDYTSLKYLDLSFNELTGSLPLSLFTLDSLESLFLGNNSLSGSLPNQKSSNLLHIDLSYNELTGTLPSWVNDYNLQLNLVANKFVSSDIDSTVLRNGLGCLQKDVPCNLGTPIYYSFAINCGGSRNVRSSDGIVYEMDNENLTTASYYMTDTMRWAVSSAGSFLDAPDPRYIQNTSSQIMNTSETELYQEARLSPSSLRYYGLGLENGNYNVKLQFAEIAFPDNLTWLSFGKRIFDIYIQGTLVAKNFDIRKEAGRSFQALQRQFTTNVTNNFLEIHFFWAGKGTCCIPTRGYYGPLISAISVTPNFRPTVRNNPPTTGLEKEKHTALIAGIVSGVAVLFFLVASCFCLWRQKWSPHMNDNEDLQTLNATPIIFSYAELRTATESFSLSNKLGEGGFGSVYKGKLSDGRVVAVKQLSEESTQGKLQFMAELATISAIDHRNLVKLYGCCYEKENRILVYEYLENKSLDQALLGNSDFHLDWPTRFKICLGTARALAYLHEESRIRIIHRDVKASNILLDSEFNPKISDFGLAKLYDEDKTHMSTKVAGTIGYLAPEYAMRGHATEKVDVFAFGVVALEIISGRKNTMSINDENKVYLLEWAWHLHENNIDLDIMDTSLSSYDKEEAMRVIGVALMCTQAFPSARPAMSRVVAMLLGDAEVSDVASKPAYLADWHFNDDGTSSSMSRFNESPSPVTLIFNSH